MEQSEKEILLNTDAYLYDAIRAKLGSEYTNVTNESMQEDKPGSVGIYLYQSKGDERTFDGVEFENIKVQIQVNAEQSEEGINKAKRYLRQWVYRMEDEDSDIPEISFIYAAYENHPVISMGKNKFNISVYRAIVDLSYCINKLN